MSSSAEPDSGGTEALDRSQQSIDEAKDAARTALDDPAFDSDLDVPGVGDGLEKDQEDVTPRPT